VSWFKAQRDSLKLGEGTPLERAYRVFLAKLSVAACEAPIVEKRADRIVIHSRNFCPTLEACRILGLDTRQVCARMTEGPMDKLLKQVDPRLCFSRNYEAIRPNGDYCEETISLRE
jgi:tRNA(adenine34) deaminase